MRFDLDFLFILYYIPEILWTYSALKFSQWLAILADVLLGRITGFSCCSLLFSNSFFLCSSIDVFKVFHFLRKRLTYKRYFVIASFWTWIHLIAVPKLSIAPISKSPGSAFLLLLLGRFSPSSSSSAFFRPDVSILGIKIFIFIWFSYFLNKKKITILYHARVHQQRHHHQS